MHDDGKLTIHDLYDDPLLWRRQRLRHQWLVAYSEDDNELMEHIEAQIGRHGFTGLDDSLDEMIDEIGKWN